jgi:hypothetical protein
MNSVACRKRTCLWFDIDEQSFSDATLAQPQGRFNRAIQLKQDGWVYLKMLSVYRQRSTQRKKNLQRIDYTIIAMMSACLHPHLHPSLDNPNHSRRLISWARRNKNCFSGTFLDLLPSDILATVGVYYDHVNSNEYNTPDLTERHFAFTRGKCTHRQNKYACTSEGCRMSYHERKLN